MLTRRRGRWCAVAGLCLSALASGTAAASPAVDGTRNLSLGSVARSSSFGTNAALINPSNMAFARVFAIEPMYQLGVQSRTNGIGIIIMDSLNNARVGLGLGYAFMTGKPRISFLDEAGENRSLELSRFGHEVLGAVSVTIVKRWLAVGVKPKYQYSSLRYRDEEGLARNANDKLNSFGLDVGATANFAGWAAVSVTADNLVGNHRPAFTDTRPVDIQGLSIMQGTIDHKNLPEVSDYPLLVAHGVSVFPLHHPDFSLNFDGTYDFATYTFEDHTRLTYGGSAEFVLGPVPLRFGTVWDGRGKGSQDDRVFVAGGIGYVKPAPIGGVGVDAGLGFMQQVSGPKLTTVIGLNLGIRIHPDL